MAAAHTPRTIAEAKRAGCPLARGRFLRINDVIATTGLSRATIYRLINSGEFPQPVRLTARSVGWWEAAVSTWLDSRLSAA
ncbi:AlpA family transcriptional regulator [Sphingomonas sp. BK235]|uniref:helix-turn-helix transcriptional regulator n=1 Tax=Sphingomonas sp. BK235 TaxID=2512131 RepID=UPI00104F4BC2|nr:AlpA family transcriptional regulator [Sphingomonas sp. BK235]TCP33242.1 AlpA family transcriptional regulator [Sphingomonas sp. BK235]